MEILNNPWVSGIGGGIISGLFVYLITNYVLSKQQNKEYFQKLTTANNELIYALRPFVAQKQIPSIAIINSIIESVARKNQIKITDLSNVKILVDDLTREVMENPFLDSEQKLDFCEQIQLLKSTQELEAALSPIESGAQNKELNAKSVSILMAATVSLMVAISSIYAAFIKPVLDLNIVSKAAFLSIIASMMALATLSLYVEKMKKIK